MPATIENRQRRIRISPLRLRRATERALAAVGRPGGLVDVTVVDDDGIRALNAAFRGVRRRTDVLAFPLETPEAAAGLVGQIVVSAETAARQAARLDIPCAWELELLVTHGVLHLVGYDDRDPLEADLMHRREREILSMAGRRPPPRLWSGLLPAGGRGARRGHGGRRAPGGLGGPSRPIRAWGSIEERAGVAGARRAPGGLGGPSRPRIRAWGSIEERGGFAGARRAPGGLGGPSRPPMSQ